MPVEKKKGRHQSRPNPSFVYNASMQAQDLVKFCSLGGGAIFLFLAFYLTGKRLRLILPAVLLLALGTYEVSMGYWEKTVHAPIRLDMLAEIPLMVVCLIWSALAAALPGKKSVA
ncbi:MAG TPA: hypothetical protein VEW69_13390 [Alphaproteobacteria bacterium]|nr:hypothetical protein [Alphaproteobacteria bacterium]